MSAAASSNPTTRPASVPGPPARVAHSAWGLLAFLTFLNVLNFVDRTLISSLAPLLIADLGLSRAQIGLLAGFGFVFVYSFVGLWLGLAADRLPRLKLLAGGLGLWSAMTAVSGLARGFGQLALPRLFVGVGEATLTPAALSMLGDAFPPRRLAVATGIYYTGVPLGAAASFAVAGFVAPRWGWRACFYILGIVGLVAVAGLFLLREPARRGRAGGAPPPDLRRILADVVGALRARRTLVLTLAGGALLCYGAGAALHAVTWLVEERGFPFARAAYTSGVIAVLAGLVGNVAGGMFGDACARRLRNGHLWSLAAMTAFFVPVGWVFYQLAPGTPLFYACWFVTSAGTSAWFGPLFASIQEQSPVHTRSTMVAFALLVINLGGVGPGPLVTGMIGDARGLTTGLLASLGVVALAILPLVMAARSAPPHPVLSESEAMPPASG